MSGDFGGAGVCLRFQRLSSMFQRCSAKGRWSEQKRQVQRFFYKGLVGLKGSSDKASERIRLCQDLHCGENGIITDKKR